MVAHLSNIKKIKGVSPSQNKLFQSQINDALAKISKKQKTYTILVYLNTLFLGLI